MSLYEELKPKQRRTIKRDIDLIFSLKGLSFPKTIDEIREIGFLSPSVHIKNRRQIYFSQNGKVALYRICDSIHQSSKFRNLLNYNDIFQGVISEIERWLKDNLVPNDQEFIEPLDILLSKQIANHVFVCKVDGLSLENIDIIIIGNREIKKYDKKIVAQISDCHNLKDVIDKEYDNNLIITGIERGSTSVAQEKFYHNAELSLSVLRLYACAFHSQAIHKINIQLINNCAHSYGTASSFGWTETKKSLIFSRYFKSEQDFKIEPELLEHLGSICFFQNLSNLIDKKSRNALEEAIVKSLFWIGEAQKDPSHASAWVKLWSCMECFFTLSEEEITKKNVRGISSILIWGDYSHEKYNDYDFLKKKINKYYNLRSKVVHRAEYTNIDIEILEEFSLIVAWVIITMISLLNRGYTSLVQVQAEAERLDKIKAKSNQVKSIDS